MSRAISSKVSRYYICRLISGRKTKKEVGCTAVTTKDPSVSSNFPPGKAV